MKKKLKILHITTSGNFGGTEKMIYSFLKNSPNYYIENRLVILKDKGFFYKKAKELNINTHFLNVKNLFFLPNLLKLIFIIKSFKPDIIHSYLFHSNITARIFGKLCGVRHIICGQRNIDSWKKNIHIFLDKITAGLCDLIISNTLAGKKRLVEIEKINPNKIIVIPNGIENIPIPSYSEIKSWKEKYNIKENEFIISNIASLTEKKGQIYLIEALSLISMEFNNVKLIISGKGPMEQQLKEFASKKNVTEKIIFTGFIENIALPISASDIFVLPSLWEGMPNTILEAMYFGKIVIATNVGGTPEIIEDGKNGFLIPPKNPKAIYEKIKYCINNKNNLKQIQSNAKKKVEECFRMEIMIKKLLETYKKISAY